MDKLIIFDMDGVLIDSKQVHYKSLNRALSLVDEKFIITGEEQLSYFEGLPTREKLYMLSELKGLNPKYYDMIWQAKQVYTAEYFNQFESDDQLKSFLSIIKSFDVKVAVASNAIKSTIETVLKKLGIDDLVDYIVSNECVTHPKPHPEMYWKAMSHFNTIPSQTVIFEDSIVGKIAVMDSGAHLVPIKDRKDLGLKKIINAIDHLYSQAKHWSDLELNVLIPMAGNGTRFAEKGYQYPKPLIDVDGVPMIQAVVNNLNIKAQYTFIVQESHYIDFNLQSVLTSIVPGCNIVRVSGLTEGAAMTCLMAKQYIDNDRPLVIANSDQLLNWDARDFLYDLYTSDLDARVATFTANDAKWSYVKVENDLVTKVAEKKAISNIATVGVYAWKKGSDFVKYARQMIAKDIRTNNEFYVAPVFNEAILDNKKIGVYNVKMMIGLGTPEDLEKYKG